MILAAAMALAPVAVAGPAKEVTLTMDYDPALLTTDAGVESLVSSLESKARKLCSTKRTSSANSPSSGTSSSTGTRSC